MHVQQDCVATTRDCVAATQDCALAGLVYIADETCVQGHYSVVQLVEEPLVWALGNATALPIICVTCAAMHCATGNETLIVLGAGMLYCFTAVLLTHLSSLAQQLNP